MNNKKVCFFLLAFVVVFMGVVATSVKATKAAVEIGENRLSLSEVSRASQISISGQVIWNDNFNPEGRRPSSVTINLFADGVYIASKVVSEVDNWQYTFDNIPDQDNGYRIKYQVSEDVIQGYDASYDGYTITNSATPISTTRGVIIGWNDEHNYDRIRPSSLKAQLYANGQVYDTVYVNSNWRYIWHDLPAMSNGQPVFYSVVVTDAPSGYIIEKQSDYNGTSVFVYQHIPEVSATIHYDANTGNTASLPADATTTFQPSETGTVTLSDQVPTKTADEMYTYTFKEWNTQADGLGTAYQAGDEIDNLAVGSTTTLYAQWNQTLKSSTVTTHYVDTEGNTIADDVLISDAIGSEYTTQALGEDMLVNGEITYTLVSTPTNATGTYTSEGIEVTYVYSLSKSIVPDPIASSTVTVRHVDSNGIALASDVVSIGEVGDTYTTSALSGKALVIGDTTYELSEVPDNANGVYGMSNTVVTYVYTIVDDEVEAPIEKPSITPSIPKVEEPIKKPSIAPSTPKTPATEISKGYPDTGDTTDISMLIALMVVSGLIIGVYKKKKTV